MSAKPLEPVEEEVAPTDDNESYDAEESVVDSEYPEDGLRLLAETLITANGEVIADVMAGIRDALEKLNKVLYSKLGK